MSLAQAYKHCGRITRRSAGNFYYAFLALPKPKRQALHAIYAFCRICDDIVDDAPDVVQAENNLNQWQQATRDVFAGRSQASQVLLATHDACQRYAVPGELLHEVIAGVRMDLSHTRYADFGALSDYCWKVASAVGLMVVHILGFRNQQDAYKLALYQGLAMQLTNILRDLHEDAAMGRIYLPQDELKRFGYTEADLMQGVHNDAFDQLMQFQTQRVQNFYDRADYYQQHNLSAQAHYVCGALHAIYAEIFKRITSNPAQVLQTRITLPWHKKLALACAAKHKRNHLKHQPVPDDLHIVQTLLQRYTGGQTESSCLDGRELSHMQLPGRFQKAYSKWSEADACAFTQWLSRHHYENFNVVSCVLPKAARKHFFRLYTFCRMTDDLGDEAMPHATSLELLDAWEADLMRDNPQHPVLCELKKSIHQCAIPMELFQRLIQANRMDQHNTSYESFDGILHYCEHSATPVGRMLLYVLDQASEKNLKLSDSICIGLQLANFWQDVQRDIVKGRIYIPCEDMLRFDYSPQQLLKSIDNQAFRQLMRFEVDRARQYFVQGAPLAQNMHKGAFDIKLFVLGGMAILDAIEHIDYDVLHMRPTISGWQKLGLMFKGVFDYGSTIKAGN